MKTCLCTLSQPCETWHFDVIYCQRSLLHQSESLPLCNYLLHYRVCACVCVCLHVRKKVCVCVCALFNMLRNFVLITFTFLHQYWMTCQSIVPPWMAFPWTYSSKSISGLAKILINSQAWTACVHGIWYYNSHRSPISCKLLDLCEDENDATSEYRSTVAKREQKRTRAHV